MNLPNCLTVLRLLLVPVFVWSYFGAPGEYFYLASLILVLSGLTDVLDGYIARKYNLITQLGQFLDPLADKITICAVIICLGIAHPSIWVLLGFFVIKELTLATFGLLKLKTWRNSPPAQWYGKLTTVLLYFLMFAVMLVPMPETLILGLIFVPITFMILSFIFYSKEIKKHKDEL